MRNGELMRTAFASILSRKVRSFLTSLGVIIGVFAVAALLSVGEASIRQMNELMQGLNANIVQVSVNSDNASISAKEIESLADADGVSAAAPYLQTGATARSGINEMKVTVVATTAAYAAVKDYHLTSGRFIVPVDNEEVNNAAVLGQSVVMKLFGHTDIAGEPFMLNGREYIAVGVLAETDASIGENANERIFIPLASGQEHFALGDITRFALLANSAEDIQNAKSAAQTFLNGKVDDPDDYSISASDDINEFLNESNRTMMALLGGIGGISLLVSGIGIMNIMLVSVRERTREIGIRKAIGARRRDILTQFLLEAVVLSALGGIAGIALTFGLSSPVSALMDMPVSLSVSTVLLSLAFSVSVGVAFGVYPAIKASKLRPVEALHYE